MARYTKFETSDITSAYDDDALINETPEDERVEVSGFTQHSTSESPEPTFSQRKSFCNQKRVFYSIWAGVTVVLFFLVIILAAHSKGGDNHSAPAATPAPSLNLPCLSADCVQIAARVISNINFSANPCTDFYQYACGGWIANNAIPEDQTRVGTFDALERSNEAVLQTFLQSSGTRASTMKAITYYQACMNMTTINRLAISDFYAYVSGPLLAAQSLEARTQLLHKLDVGALFSVTIGPDDKNGEPRLCWLTPQCQTTPSLSHKTGWACRPRHRISTRRSATAPCLQRILRSSRRRSRCLATTQPRPHRAQQRRWPSKPAWPTSLPLM